MSIEAVIFDWGGTLTPWHVVDAKDAWRQAVLDQAVADALAAAEDALWIRSKEEHVSATLHDVLEAAGIDADDEMLAKYHGWWDAHTYTDPDVPELFAALRERGIKIGVLSNTIWPRDRHESIFARDEVLALLDGAVYSSEIPWTKPHPKAFQAAMDALGVTDPARAVYVGDRLFDDIHGAKGAGMRAVLVPHSVIPDWQRGHTEGEPDAVIHRLIDLVEVIDRWR